MSLIGAVRSNDVNKVMQLLTTNKAIAHEIDGNEWTPLMYAAYHGRKEIVELLLDHDNSPEHINSQNNDGHTALMCASYLCRKKIVEILLNHDNSQEHINLQNKFGETALMFASRRGHKKIVELLLEHDADINILNKKDELAIDVAKTEEVKELLLNWEPKGVIRAKGV